MGHIERNLKEYPVALVDKETLVREFSSFLSTESVKYKTEDLTPFECDGLSAYPQIPLIAVLPENEEQVCHVMKVCNQFKVPIVFRGAGTGLSGGAIPYDQGVLLVLSKLKRIVHVDPIGRYAIVQPGVRNAAISEATKKHNLYYAPDPSSQIACSIGGNVAENSGGVHCLKYGLTVNNILKIRLVTIEGDIVEIGSEGLDSPGYDLLALITGSEGLLGVVTEVTVKLLPTPEKAQVIMASFDDVEKAGLAVADIIAAGIIPAGLEMMDKKAINAVEQFIGAGYPMDAEAMLLCDLMAPLKRSTAR